MLSAETKTSSLYNDDLAPVEDENRTWGLWTIASLWVGMAVCVPTYMLASGMISQGMNWWQALLTVALGNVIVCIPMVLNAHPGTKYGIPFPVLVRASFGTIGANIPAVMRGLVACGWFGIQTYVGGAAIYTLAANLIGFDPAKPADQIAWLGLSLGQFACFMIFWAINVVFIVIGTDSIKWLERFSAPFLIVVGLMLLWWATNHEKVQAAGGFSAMMSDDTVARLRDAKAGAFDFWRVFWPNLTAMVGFWATLSLNIPDFSRYTRRQRDQVVGQLVGLPSTMSLYSYIGIAVTCATVIIYGDAIWNPVDLLNKFGGGLVVAFALFALTIATLSTNLAANVVSPANDFSNLAPRLISFRMGGIITALIGVVIMPWKLFNDPSGYIFTWLLGYSSLLGAIGGIMIADYYMNRRMHLDVDALYRHDGEYAYGGSGFNWRAIAALVVGILPCVPGFLYAASNKAIEVPVFYQHVYDYAWFVSFALAFLVYMQPGKGSRAEG